MAAEKDPKHVTEEDLLLCKKNVDDQLFILRQDIEMLNEIRDDVKEMLSIFRASKGFVRVLGWLGIGVRWIIGICAVLGIGWYIKK